MKKMFLSAAMLAGSLFFAQTYSFGVKTGLNLSSISDDGKADNKMKTGFNGGIFANVALTDKFSIQPEVLYNTMGAKSTLNLDADKEPSDYKTKLGYLYIPIMFQYNIAPHLYIEAGPEFSFLMNASSEYTSGTKYNNFNLGTNDFKTFNFGMGVGVGYWIIPRLAVNARYSTSFTNAADDTTTRGAYFGNGKNSAFQIGLTVKIFKLTPTKQAK